MLENTLLPQRSARWNVRQVIIDNTTEVTPIVPFLVLKAIITVKEHTQENLIK
jgi:hypothetical protein